MSIKFISNLILDVYIKEYLISNINFNSKESLESYLKKLFKTLKNKYNITINGFYEITVYRDPFYGVVFHLEKEELEYYEYFKNQVDMRISVIDTDFLYEVEDIPNYLIGKIRVCKLDNKVYVKLKEKLNELEMMKLIENSKLVYNK